MNKIYLTNATKSDLRNAKKELKAGDIFFVMLNEDYIATLNEDDNEHINFSDEIPNNYWRDCFLNANNTMGFIFKVDKFVTMGSPTDMSNLVANIWYTVLSDYLPVERVRFKVRTLNSKCAVDCVSNIVGDEIVTIGYANLGTEFNQPNYDSLVKNRDEKGKLDIPKEEFENIINRVFEYLQNILEG